MIQTIHGHGSDGANDFNKFVQFSVNSASGSVPYGSDCRIFQGNTAQFGARILLAQMLIKMSKKAQEIPKIFLCLFHFGEIFGNAIRIRGSCKLVTSELEYEEGHGADYAVLKSGKTYVRERPRFKIGHDHAFARRLKEPTVNFHFSPGAVLASDAKKAEE